MLRIILSLVWVLSASFASHVWAEPASEGLAPLTGAKPLYVCPMHPQIQQDHPGVCPICGMDLVLQQVEDSVKTPTVSIKGGDSSQQAGFAIRTAEVQKTTLWKYIETFGKVVPDETQVVHIHPRASGWLSDLGVRNAGDFIEKGQLLYRLYSPEIVSAQQDYLLALQNAKRLNASASAKAAAESIVDSAQTRLTLLGVDKSTQIKIAKQQKPIYQLPVFAPQSGVAAQLVVQNGMYVEPKTELMSLTNLQQVWVEAEVLPLQQDWLKTGLTVELHSEAVPQASWETHISYLYPTVDNKTQALKVRMPLANAEGQFKPNQLLNVVIYGGPKHDTLAIPMEAVIDDGQSQRVVKQLDDGQFSSVTIRTGMQTRGLVEVLSGLAEGDRIVVSGQFLLDSESQIQQNLRRFQHSSAAMPDMTKAQP